MAEQKINELPVTPLAEFTDNDFFVIINDNKGEIIERTKVLNWIQANVQGEKGDQGVADSNSIPSPNGYILEVASSKTDAGLTVNIDAITRISYAKESNHN